MELQERLERDLKTALLAGDKKRAETIRGLKNSIQYAAVELRIQKSDLKDDQIMNLLAKEAKKRQEAIDLYQRVGEAGRAAEELAEKQIIEGYLPAKISDDEAQKIVLEELGRVENPSLADMGRIIGQVKQRLGAQADGAVIAKLVKQALESQ